MPLYISSTDVNVISEVIDDASMSVVSAYNDAAVMLYQHDVARPDQIAESLDRFIEILLLAEVEQDHGFEYHDILSHDRSSKETSGAPMVMADMSEIGNHGLKLLQTLGEWAGTLHLPDVQHQIQMVMVTVSLWVARHGGTIDHLDSVVSTLTSLANTTSDRDFLSELSNIMGELSDAVSTNIKFNPTKHNQSKSWRTLNISRGIVASRSFDPRLMTSAFDQLAQNLPEDASIFFEEGVLQMDSLGYPEEVRNLMSKYFYQYTASTLH